MKVSPINLRQAFSTFLMIYWETFVLFLLCQGIITACHPLPTPRVLRVRGYLHLERCRQSSSTTASRSRSCCWCAMLQAPASRLSGDVPIVVSRLWLQQLQQLHRVRAEEKVEAQIFETSPCFTDGKKLYVEIHRLVISKHETSHLTLFQLVVDQTGAVPWSVHTLVPPQTLTAHVFLLQKGPTPLHDGRRLTLSHCWTTCRSHPRVRCPFSYASIVALGSVPRLWVHAPGVQHAMMTPVSS